MPAQIKDVAELLLEREAYGLQFPIIARLVFMVFGVFTALTGPDVPSSTLSVILVSASFSVALNIYFLRLLRRRRHVSLVGWIGVLYDVISVTTYPFILSSILMGHGLHWAYIFKAPFTLVCLSFVVINALALRPQYPTVIGAVSMVVYVVMLLLARGDPAVTWSEAFRPQLTGPDMGQTMILFHVAFIALITAAIFFITRHARKTVEEAVERQAERARLVREHAASVMEGRLDALRNLVASLSHEMNSPVGAVKSASATIGSAVRRLADHLQDRDEKVGRLMKLLTETAQIPEKACARLDAMLDRLTAFSHLDASEARSVEVNEALDRTVALVPADLVGDSEVVRDYAAQSRVHVQPARLNLALMTIVTNAFEANQGRGQVRLSTSEDASSVMIEIEDQGPGIPADHMERIFEFHLDDAASRVKAGFGLPAAYSLIKKHHGDIVIKSAKGGGTSFVISLPRVQSTRDAGSLPLAEA